MKQKAKVSTKQQIPLIPLIMSILSSVLLISYGLYPHLFFRISIIMCFITFIIPIMANYFICVLNQNKADTQNDRIMKEVHSYIRAQKYIESKPYANRRKYVVAKSGSSYYVVKKATIQAFNGITEATASSKASSLASSQKANAIYWKYASGIASVGSNQMALVGDDPRNRELVIGSKLNGTAMSLQKGSGVVNAESTKTLAGLMNCLGKFSSSNFGAGNGILNTNTSNSNDMYIDKVVIEGSNITDVVSFKNSLMNLKSEATQRAYKHS